jgi:hypothetical protein
LKLENVISNEFYLEKNNKLENQLLQIEEEKKRLKNSDFQRKTQIMLELAGSLYKSYLRANLE